MNMIDENIYQKIDELILVFKDIAEILKEINVTLENLSVNIERGF